MIVKPSIAFEDMRKSAGGVTASKNKARLYILKTGSVRAILVRKHSQKYGQR